jgi:nucleotide-binding universal stress UspA family protein
MRLMNDPKRRVVVGVDLSAGAESVLRWADRQALGREAVLYAVTVAVDPSAHAALAETINSALPADRARLVKLRVSEGKPALALMREARRAELLVVGAHSPGGMSGLLLGSVTEYVVAHASCPVAVVHPRRHPRTGRIAVGVDGSDCSRQALTWALRQADISAAQVEVITAWEWRPQYGYAMGMLAAPDETQERWAQELLARELGRLEPEDAAKVTGRVQQGNAAAVLVDASVDADMIVVGNHGSGGAVGRLLGSVSQKVARHSQVPVVVVHDHDRSAP